MHSNTLEPLPDDVPLAEAAPALYEQPIQGLPAQLNESVHRPTIFKKKIQSVLCSVNLFLRCFSDVELKFCN